MSNRGFEIGVQQLNEYELSKLSLLRQCLNVNDRQENNAALPAKSNGWVDG